MEQEDRQFSVTWRGKIFILKMNPMENLKALGDELQALTNVKAETMRLIVPMKKSSQLIYPFSDEHSHVSLEAAPIHEGVSIRMMGVLENEVNEVIQNSKADQRIAGFDEEDKRMRMRVSNGRDSWPKLPQGTYLFSEFRTLHLPGIVLNPPSSEALKLMHRLAADPGIVAIMNKHRWRVGIMTEMAPVGYVGVSPMCILGFNKNHGEEISLRLRTDDLNGFRKYESIKKTLLHELAHMVHSEHDANFYALDKQLNKEAATLDWTKSKGHTLSGGIRHSHYFEDEDADTMSSSHKLGGQTSVFSSARESSAAAAYRRFVDASIDTMRMPDIHEEEPDPDDSEYTTYESNSMDDDRIAADKDTISMPQNALNHEPDQNLGYNEIRGPFEQYHDNSKMQEADIAMGENIVENNEDQKNDLDESGLENENLESNPTDDNSMIISERKSIVNRDEPDPDDKELQRIQDPVSAICSRLQKAREMLTSESNFSEASSVVEKLIKIIKNVIDHPEETKYRRLRKANPIIKRDIISHRGAMEILNVIGFREEETVFNEVGNAEAYLVLKRNDPGLLWIAKTTLENSDG